MSSYFDHLFALNSYLSTLKLILLITVSVMLIKLTLFALDCCAEALPS